MTVIRCLLRGLRRFPCSLEYDEDPSKMPADIVQSVRRGMITTAATLCDQARAALVTRMDPKPIDGDAESGAHADQKIDVCDAPDPPCKSATQLDEAEIDDRAAFANLRQAAGMLVTEHPDRLVPA